MKLTSNLKSVVKHTAWHRRPIWLLITPCVAFACLSSQPPRLIECWPTNIHLHCAQIGTDMTSPWPPSGMLNCTLCDFNSWWSSHMWPKLSIYVELSPCYQVQWEPCAYCNSDALSISAVLYTAQVGGRWIGFTVSVSSSVCRRYAFIISVCFGFSIKLKSNFVFFTGLMLLHGIHNFPKHNNAVAKGQPISYIYWPSQITYVWSILADLDIQFLVFT